MTILDLRGGGRFLSEALPHLFPDDTGISETEVVLWEMYYKSKEERGIKHG